MAAYLIGLGERMIEVTGEYARQREQFGKPIGAFQAVKHLMADALLKVEFAKPATYAAAWSLRPTRRGRLDGQGLRQRSRLPGRAGAHAGSRRHRLHLGSRPPAVDEEGLGAQRAWGDASLHRRRVADEILAPLS